MSFVIGSLKLNDKIMVAPMAGVTDKPFRFIVRKFSDCLLWSEMISANSLIRSHKTTMRMAEVYQDEKPIAVQIVGNDPFVIAKACQIAEDKGACLIDINMGCPVKKLISNISGAALMKEPKMVAQIVKEAKKAISVPLSVKIRAGWDNNNLNAPEIANIAESEGADMIIVHGRTRDQLYAGEVNLDIIAKVKANVTIPVVGNGDIFYPEDALKMMTKTSCDAVMIGRGILGRPWAASYISNAINGIKDEQIEDNKLKKQIVLEHYNKILNYYGERNGIKIARKHICWYSKTIKNGAEFRKHFNVINDLDIAKNMIKEFF